MAQSRGSVPVPVQKRTEQVELFVEQVHRRTAQGIYCLSTCMKAISLSYTTETVELGHTLQRHSLLLFYPFVREL